MKILTRDEAALAATRTIPVVPVLPIEMLYDDYDLGRQDTYSYEATFAFADAVAGREALRVVRTEIDRLPAGTGELIRA